MKTKQEIDELAQQDLYPQFADVMNVARKAYRLGYDRAQSDMDVVDKISFAGFLDLRDAYSKAASNEECAKILRLFACDYNEFRKEYGSRLQDFENRINN